MQEVNQDILCTPTHPSQSSIRLGNQTTTDTVRTYYLSSLLFLRATNVDEDIDESSRNEPRPAELRADGMLPKRLDHIVEGMDNAKRITECFTSDLIESNFFYFGHPTGSCGLGLCLRSLLT